MLASLLALGTASQPMQAQPHTPSQPKIDSVLLAEEREGEQLIRRYRVDEAGHSDFALHYRINQAQLSSQFDKNGEELQALEQMLLSLTKDTTLRVRQIAVTGYTSPDGPHPFNEQLARERTSDFVAYTDKKHHLSDHFPLTSSSVAEPWESCRTMVAQSAIPDRDTVLKILDDKHLTADQKEHALKQMPSAWEYLKEQILPHLRRVEVAVNFDRERIVEVRTPIPQPKPAPKPEAKPTMAQKPRTDPCGECLVVDEAITGFLVEFPEKR